MMDEEVHHLDMAVMVEEGLYEGIKQGFNCSDPKIDFAKMFVFQNELKGLVCACAH